VLEGHETELRPFPFGSTETGVDQAVPFQVSALPERSTATQKVLEGHETEVRPYTTFGSTETGVDQLVPFQVSALPEEPTAPQKVLEGHETEVRNAFGSTETGVDQLVPFQVSALPESSTAAQKVLEGHETEERPPCSGSIRVGVDQVSAGACGLTTIESVLVAVAPEGSVTATVKLDVLAVVGVPEMVPPEESERPPGSWPLLSDQV